MLIGREWSLLSIIFPQSSPAANPRRPPAANLIRSTAFSRCQARAKDVATSQAEDNNVDDHECRAEISFGTALPTILFSKCRPLPRFKCSKPRSSQCHSPQSPGTTTDLAEIQRPPVLDQRFSVLKKSLVKPEHKAKVIKSYETLCNVLKNEAEFIAKNGPSMVPEIDFNEVRKNGIQHLLCACSAV